ncbi:maleate cis-trans isomerase [Paraburkholderia sp. MM5496-R1]|uniref:maleate cis-trans isomerase family protein n=1 Tax=Paraburkholderia sp. MM5496-R1 TaxID=2991065 RepID=UPI003D203245
MNIARKGLRVGVMIPENNTTVERELPRWLPAGTRLNLVRIPRGKGLLTTETLPAYKANALALAQQFATNDVDVVAYGCTAAGFILGPAGDRELTKDLRRITGKPVATIAQSMISALLDLGVQRIALVTPYSKAVNEQLQAFIASAGIQVGAFDSFYAPNTEELGRIDAEAVASLARKTMNDSCEAMYIACAQLPTFSILENLRRELGRPVLSSIQSLADEIGSLASGEYPGPATGSDSDGDQAGGTTPTATQGTAT